MMRWSPAPPPRPGCQHRRLRRLLARELPHGLSLGISTLRPWASANFVGARHLFDCAYAVGEAAALRSALQDRLSRTQWALPGHIVADVAVEAGEPGLLRIEMLTVED
ncbi:hypothetical protein [Sphingopyxis witflariensis]|uniref:hypothetical protein n=1 Tax=Sphingopyxis witflariensis TaxID=173675 RepID=UPI0013DDFC7F|nr:hypothetical protein [Sphingopyxis witflariensis]